MRFLPRSYRNYQRDVSDGAQSSIVLACVGWICRNFPEAPVKLEQKKGTDWEIVDDHDMLDLLERPNPFYSGVAMWHATLFDWTVYGNAYWIKVKSRGGKLLQLWYTPQSLIRPVADDKKFIKGYEYCPPGYEPIKLDVEDVVHFRNGIDPRDIRMGRSPLMSLFREIFTDDEAANFTASLLANFGVPGVIIAPAAMNGSPFQLEIDAESIKEEYMRGFGGDKRGEPMILTAPTDIKVLSFSPQQMDVKSLRRVPEERVTAVLGLNAMVVGLGAGLEHSTFSNYAESREAAYENNIMPTQRLMSAELKHQLLSDYVAEGELRQWRVGFDHTQVRALQEDQTALYTRANLAVAGGWATVAEARQSVGMKTDETHDIYLRTSGMTVVPKDEGGKPPEDDPAKQAMAQAQVDHLNARTEMIRNPSQSPQTGQEPGQKPKPRGNKPVKDPAVKSATVDLFDKGIDEFLREGKILV